MDCKRIYAARPFTLHSADELGGRLLWLLTVEELHHVDGLVLGANALHHPVHLPLPQLSTRRDSIIPLIIIFFCNFLQQNHFWLRKELKKCICSVKVCLEHTYTVFIFQPQILHDDFILTSLRVGA